MDRHKKPPPAQNSSAIVAQPIASKVAREQSAYVPKIPYGVEREDNEDGGGLVEHFRTLLRHKKTIFVAAFLGAVIGFMVGVPMTPVYRAHATLEVLNINEDFMNMKQASPTTTSNGDSDDTSEEETQARLLEGAALLKRVSAKLDPAGALLPEKPRMATSGWRSWLHQPEPASMNSREMLVAGAANTLKVRAVPRTRVLEVSVDSKDPQFAADFANTLAREFILQNLETRYEATHKTSEWLQREIEDARLKLQESEDALQKYARESGLIFTDENTNVATEKLQQVQQQLSGATADRISKEARYKLSKSSPPDSLADVLGDKNLQDTSAKLNELRRQVASLSAVFNPGYNKLQEAQAEMAATEVAFEHDRAQVLQRIANDYQQSVSNEKLLSSAYDTQTREVTGQSEKSIQYNILKREVDSNRQLYDTMLQQTKQASIASAMRPSNVRVIDPAEAPDKPISPNFKLNSILGLLSGLLFSIVFVTARDRADRTLQQPGDIKLWVNLPELGSIPSAQSKALGYNRAASIASAYQDGGGFGNRALSPRVEQNRPELMTWQQKPSAVAEAFRSVLTSILFIGENGDRPRVLVFTSASPADGKTTIVSNLAIASAEIRHKVIIIDADLRRPRMHQVFSLANERGLSDLLTEEYSSQAVADLIQETGVPGVHVLTGGPPTQASVHLLYSVNFATLIEDLKEQYDMILIDTPPMLQMTDARVAGRLADAVVVVARAGQTTRDSLLAVRQRFDEDRTHVLGTILNDWDPRTSRTGYYGNYRNSYYIEYRS
jgi:capsular exopolysaccharide synthesis family protein